MAQVLIRQWLLIVLGILIGSLVSTATVPGQFTTPSMSDVAGADSDSADPRTSSTLASAMTLPRIEISENAAGTDHASAHLLAGDPPAPRSPSPAPSPEFLAVHFIEPHFTVRNGGAVQVLPDGLVLVAEPFCGTPCKESPHPNVLWYCMEASGMCSPCPFAPYKVSVPPPPGYPNPNRPSMAGHANVTRHWASDPTYYVYVADNLSAPPALPTLGGFVALPTDVLFGAMGLTAIPYTFVEFVWDVAWTMGKYSRQATLNPTPPPSFPPIGFPLPHPCSPYVVMPAVIGNPHSTRTAIFGGMAAPSSICSPPSSCSATVNTGPYWSVGFPTMTGLIWHTSTAVAGVQSGGPTGNGLNEIMFLRLNLGVGTGGMTSMIMDPRSGRIVECDVIFETTGIPTGRWPSTTGLAVLLT